MFADVLLKFGLATAIYNHRADVSAALQHSHHKSLILAASSSDDALTLRLVHIPRQPADEGLINFHFAGEFSALLALLSKSDSVEHEPCGLSE